MTNRVSVRTLALKHYTALTIKQCRLLGVAAGYARATGTSPRTQHALDRLMLSLVMSRKVSKADRLAVIRYILEHARDGNKKTQLAKAARVTMLVKRLDADDALVL